MVSNARNENFEALCDCSHSWLCYCIITRLALATGLCELLVWDSRTFLCSVSSLGVLGRILVLG